MRILISLFLCFNFIGCAPPPPQVDLLYLRELKEHAYSGNAQSQYQLGIHYTLNSRWPWDLARGYQWFLDAAEAEHLDAQYMVAMAKQLGRGTGKDTLGAIAWLEKAAKQGHPRSQYQLGLTYLNGNGVEKEQIWGRQWLEQAAHHNHRDAQILLAALFRKGVGGTANEIEAWRWLQRAEAGGHPAAKRAKDRLTPRLTAAERQKATTLNQRRQHPDNNGLFAMPQWRYLQAALNNLGYHTGSEDGLKGPNTQAALSKYLTENKLPRDIRFAELLEHLRGKK